MAIRDKLRERVQPFLKPGEQVQQVMPAMSGISPWLLMTGGALWALLSRPKILVVTDQRIMVLRAGKLMGTTPKEFLHDLPRSTQLGPPKGLWHKITLGGELVYVHRRFHGDIRAADEAAPAA